MYDLSFMIVSPTSLQRSRWFIYDLPNPGTWLRETDPHPIQVTQSETSAAMSKVRWRWRGVVWDLFRSVRSLRSQRVLDRNPLPQPSQSSSPTDQRSFSQITAPPTATKRRRKKTKRIDETSSWPRLRTKISDPMSSTSRGRQSTSGSTTYQMSPKVSPTRLNGSSLWSKLRRKPPSEADADAVSSVSTPAQPAPASSDINFWRGRRSIEVLSPHNRMQASTRSDLSSKLIPGHHHPLPPQSSGSIPIPAYSAAGNLTSDEPAGSDIAWDSRSHSFDSRGGAFSYEGSLDEKGDEETDSQEQLTFSPKKRR